MLHFPDTMCCPYIANSFSVYPSLFPVKTEEQEEIINTKSDETAKSKHRECSPTDFCLKIASTYSILSQNASSQLLVFPSV